MRLYDTLKAAKIGAASDVFTTLRGRQAPFAKGGNTPTEKELEDTPPLSFTGIGETLIDWRINGASDGVGNKTTNLFDYVSYFNGTFVPTSEYFEYAEIELTANTEYTLTTSFTEKTGNSRETSWIATNSTTEPRTASGGLSNISPITIETNADGIIRLYKRLKGSAQVMIPTETYFTNGEWLMINEGSTALSYEPYGYKIPVTCGGETNTIYLNAPLGVSNSISMTDTGISIPTVDGSNTLSVGTTVQPSSVYIKYKE